MELTIAIFVLLAMLYCHVLEDFHLQGCLAFMKQKKWWDDNEPNRLYRYDYISSLIMHSIGWTTLIMAPLMVLMLMCHAPIIVAFSVAWMLNAIIHAITDHLKANVECISLFTDQYVHFAQIFITWIIITIMCL